MAAFLGVNLLFEALREGAPQLVSFYRLESQLDLPAYAHRGMGIMENANVSALAMTVAAIVALGGTTHRAVANRTWAPVAAIWMAFVLACLMVSRGEIAALALVTGVLLWRLRWASALRTGAVLGACLVLTGGAAWLFRDRIEAVFGWDVAGTVVARIEEVPNATASAVSKMRQDRSGASASASVPQPEIREVATVNSLVRPVIGLKPALERWRHSPVVGTGFEAAPGMAAPRYHSDWFTVLASSGIIGLAAFAALVVYFFRIDALLAVPFLVAGAVNSFIYAPQHIILLMLGAGMLAAARAQARQSRVVVFPGAEASEEAEVARAA
jgi:hypothetical protein